MNCSKADDSANSRLSRVQESLSLIEAFLRRYAPLTNAHSNDFITHELWQLIPNKIAEKLEEFENWHDIPKKCLMLKENFHFGSSTADSEQLRQNLLPSVDANCFENGLFNTAVKCAWHPSHEQCLDSFLTSAMGCTLDALNVLSSPADVFASSPTSDASKPIPFISHSMGIKKSHEIEEMASFTADMCHKYKISRVVDVGSGKGYLGTYLNLMYGLEVIELDSIQSNIEGSIARRSRLEQRWDKLRSKATGSHEMEPEAKKQKLSDDMREGSIISITSEVQCSEQLDQLMSQYLPDGTSPLSCAVTGLHTCGYLAMCVIDTFIHSTSSRALVNVGCCYHLFDEVNFVDKYIKHRSVPGSPRFPMSKHLLNSNQPTPFVLGRNARMIASQSLERLANEEETLHRHMFYRVMLQQLLKDRLGFTSNDWIVGKVGKKNADMDFTAYVRKALNKLKFSALSEKITDEEIVNHEKRWSSMEKSFHRFYLLRCCLGIVVESCILLDRLCYLLEQANDQRTGDIYEVHLFKMFDPVKSPRCYALFAMKNSSA